MEYPALCLEGLAHHREGRFEDAVASYDRAIELDSNSAVTVNSRGVTLLAMGRAIPALLDFTRAYKLDSSYVEAYLNAAAVLRDMGRFTEVLQLADRIIALRPESGTAWHLKALALDWLDQPADAIDAYAKALSFDDTIELADGRRIFLAMQSCKWDGLATATEQLLAKVDAGRLASQPFFLFPLPSSPSQQRATSELFSKKIVSSGSPSPSFRPRPRGQKIRVGYFSPDLPRPTSHLIAGLIEAHDRADFEIYGFAYGREAPHDPVIRRLKSAFDLFVHIDMQPNADVARMARDMNLDIAVHLAGHTSNGRSKIFDPRVAPIQVNYLGFPGTLGMETIDYLIADDIVIPAEHRQYYMEKIVSLPCYQVNDWKRPFPEGIVHRRDLGLPEDAFVFCGFHSAYKIMPREFDIWMRLLNKVVGSVLWLIGDSDEVTSNLRKEAEKRGISADRLIFASRVSVSKHMARHQAADLFLDTLTCNAHTTASDALWMGLPLITLRGNTFPSRVAASLLNTAGLPELVTRSEAEYESLALDLATNPDKLADLKRHLHHHRKTSALFDTELFAKNIEAAYRRMVEIYEAGDPPAHFSI